MADRVADPKAYKVRPAPPGYSWIHVGRDLILAQDRSGLIVDIVEGIYP
jgi:Ni/Co efflux regulator RcnB